MNLFRIATCLVVGAFAVGCGNSTGGGGTAATDTGASADTSASADTPSGTDAGSTADTGATSSGGMCGPATALAGSCDKTGTGCDGHCTEYHGKTGNVTCACAGGANLYKASAACKQDKVVGWCLVVPAGKDPKESCQVVYYYWPPNVPEGDAKVTAQVQKEDKENCEGTLSGTWTAK